MNLVPLILLILFIPQNLLADYFSGKYQYNTFEKAKNAKSVIEFTIVSTKLGLFSTTIPGYIRAFKYEGTEKKGLLLNLKVSFKVKDMDTNHRGRNKDLHHSVLNYLIAPKISVYIESLNPNDESVNAQMSILNKTYPMKISIDFYHLDSSSIEVRGSSRLSLKSLEQLGLKNPSILIAKLDDEIKVNFRILHFK